MGEDTRDGAGCCWCWQYGRCLSECPTAAHPRPVPFIDSTWKPAALALMCAPREATKETTDGDG